MKRNMIVSIILCITLLFSTSAVAFANSNITEVSNKKLVEVFTFGADYGLSEEISMERITENNNVTVRIFDSNGNLIIQSRREVLRFNRCSKGLCGEALRNFEDFA